MTKKGGRRIDAKPFSEWARQVFNEAIMDRRKLVKLPQDAQRGPRFNSNATVLSRVESNYTEAQFMACPGVAVDAMLIDAAEADHWYSHEKDYGDDHFDAEDEDDGQ